MNQQPPKPPSSLITILQNPLIIIIYQGIADRFLVNTDLVVC